MSGPVLVIELPQAVPGAVVQRLRGFLMDVAVRFEEKRTGEYDLHVRAESLGGVAVGPHGDPCPILVSLMGPGFGDASIFEAEHADEVDQERLIGFRPTHAVDVIAFRNSQADHMATALLTAAVMDVIGGVANAELREDQLPIVAGLPGVHVVTTEPSAAAYGSARFLRAWVEAPGFRLLK